MTDVERPLMYIIYGSVEMLCMRFVGEGAGSRGLGPTLSCKVSITANISALLPASPLDEKSRTGAKERYFP